MAVEITKADPILMTVAHFVKEAKDKHASMLDGFEKFMKERVNLLGRLSTEPIDTRTIAEELILFSKFTQAQRIHPDTAADELIKMFAKKVALPQ